MLKLMQGNNEVSSAYLPTAQFAKFSKLFQFEEKELLVGIHGPTIVVLSVRGKDIKILKTVDIQANNDFGKIIHVELMKEYLIFCSNTSFYRLTI